MEFVGIDQERSFTISPLFHGSNFAHWKKLMQIFIKDHDYEVWEIISDGVFIPTLKQEDKVDPKSRSEYTKAKAERVAKNHRGFNILFCCLGLNEFNHVFVCDSTKEVWDTLVTTYEGKH